MWAGRTPRWPGRSGEVARSLPGSTATGQGAPPATGTLDEPIFDPHTCLHLGDSEVALHSGSLHEGHRERERRAAGRRGRQGRPVALKPFSRVGTVAELQRLRAEHAPAVLAFELANRAYFASFISDRGDDFFDRFTEVFGERLAEQEAGSCAFHVLIDDDGTVLGRFNLVDLADGTAELGYRVAQQVAGHGVATAAVRELCRIAPARYGLHTLRAATTHDNVASRRVLTKAGFVEAGPAEPGGRPGTLYQRDLAAG